MGPPPSTPPTPAPPPSSAAALWAFVGHRYVQRTFKVVLSAGILAYLIWDDRLNLSAFYGERVSFGWVALAVLVMLPTLPIVTWRFQILLKALELPATFGQAFRWTMIGEFFNVAMPGATGGDLVKAVYLARAYGPGRRSVAALCVLLDRVLGLFGLFCFALLVCLVGGSTIEGNPRLTGLTTTLIAICAVCVVLFALLISPPVERSALRRRLFSRLPLGDKFEKVYRGLAGLRRRPGQLALVMGSSLLNHAFWNASLLILSRGLGMQFDLLSAMVVIPLALFLNTFGLAGGFGVGEAAFEALFQTMLGAPKGVGVTLAFAFHVLLLIVRFLLGLPFYLSTGHPRKEDLEEPVATPDG